MVTTRTPIGRPPRDRITPAAITAFRRYLELTDECTCEPINWAMDQYWKHRRCAACEERSKQESIIGDELRLPIWTRNTIQCPDWETHYPAGSHAAKHDKPDLEAQARWLALEAAADEAAA